MSAPEPRPFGVPRWTAAVICFLYGFAKLNGSQFTILDSELTKPMGDVSGFWLTWYYFGYSSVYGTVIALSQIVAGVLLAIPRTAVAGGLLLLPIAGNIVMVDIFYGVDPGGTLMALVLLGCAVLVVAPFVPRLLGVVLLSSQPTRPGIDRLAVLVTLLAGAWGFTWWGANYNNRFPTSIDGVWIVDAQAGTVAGASQWRRVFFERNRAHLAVFRKDGGPDEAHHFEIDSDGVVRVWEKWLTKGPLVMTGRRESDTRIHLEIAAPSGGGQLTLTRVSGPLR
jgi:hypothetical protein